MSRFDLLSPRKRKDKTYWHKVGAMFPSDRGGFSLVFDSQPLPDEKGEVRLIAKEPQQQGQQGGGKQTGGYDPDSEVPF